MGKIFQHNNVQDTENSVPGYSENSGNKYIKNNSMGSSYDNAATKTNMHNTINSKKSNVFNNSNYKNNEQANNSNYENSGQPNNLNYEKNNQYKGYNFPGNSPTNGFYRRNMNVKSKTTISAVIFWILFVVIANFNFLLLLGSKSISGAVISIIFFILLIVLRKKLYVNKALLIFALLGTFLITTSVPVLTSLDEDTDSSSENIKYNVSTNDSISVEKGVFATKIDINTFEPLEKVDHFNSDEDIMYYSFKINNLSKGTDFICTWYFEGEAFAEVPVYFDEKVVDQYFQVSYAIDEDILLPEGSYKIHIIGRKDAKIILDIVDEIEVRDTTGTKI